jgi:hypothetical protein
VKRVGVQVNEGQFGDAVEGVAHDVDVLDAQELALGLAVVGGLFHSRARQLVRQRVHQRSVAG